MGTIRFLALGAGQDVGRSCVIVTLGGRNVMFDCGMHMGYNDARRFPDFTILSPTGGPVTDVIDCVIITHFHLDHCGALPYLTEMCGYEGPVIMTHPTKALCPILLEDFRRIAVERKGESNFFTPSMIKTSVGRAIPLRIGESHYIGEDFEVRPYYAGHVLGAAMFYVRVGRESVLYTGDYNMTPDRHLGAASAELHLRPDVLITESTYATTLRDSKRARERDFLRNIHQCVATGGKVLIPVFALGRVQELCILVEAYWERMGLTVPIYFSAGMAESANEYYRIYIDWTNEKLRNDYPTRNMFDFKYVKQFEKHFADHPGPMVLFSSPGMLHSGTSLEIFKKWCHDEKNLLIIPGFCVSGTVGAKILAGQRKFEVEEGNPSSTVNVRMQVKNMSFSAHADARGIMSMIRTTKPRNVVLVHGEAAKMTILKAQIIRELRVPCFDPPNGTVLHLDSGWEVPVRLSTEIIERTREELEQLADQLSSDDELLEAIAARRAGPIAASGIVEWSHEDVISGKAPVVKAVDPDASVLIRTKMPPLTDLINTVQELFRKALVPFTISSDGTSITARTINITPSLMEWRTIDHELAQKIISVLVNK